MNKIGREVLFSAPADNNPRNGEGTFLRLLDGRILFAYTKFRGSDWGDSCTADIVAIESDDEGETWGNERILVEHTKEARNRMCPNLIRLRNGGVGLVFGKKENGNGRGNAYFIRSFDEGNTWSEPVRCTQDPQGYYVKENDHLILTKSGRLILPLNNHTGEKKADGSVTFTLHGKMFFAASDDDGETWYTLSDEYDIPFPELSATGLQETCVYERQDGTLYAISRTDMLCQYDCTSSDGGKTWSQPKPNKFFSSPDSPLLMKRVGSNTAAVFNPIPKYTTRMLGRDGKPDNRNWGRTPLVMAISTDDGKTFPKLYYLEDDPDNSYCYPAIFDGGDYILVSYYHSNGTGIPLNSNKIIKIDKSELI